jgi:hypothetical protein
MTPQPEPRTAAGEARIEQLERELPKDDPHRCACGHLHVRGIGGEDAGCPCGDAHDWERTEEHVTDGRPCWCDPYSHDAIVIHRKVGKA